MNTDSYRTPTTYQRNAAHRRQSAINIMFWGLVLFAIAAILAIAATGCATADRMYDQQVVTEPGQVIATNLVYQTNLVVTSPAVTNAATGEITAPVITQVVTPVITYDYAPPITRTNLVPKPGVEGLIGIGGSLPLPWAGPAGLALGAIYAVYANIRNKKTKVALIQGIEAGRRILQETAEGQKLDARIRAELIQHQAAAGVLNEVAKLVDSYTAPTTTSK